MEKLCPNCKKPFEDKGGDIFLCSTCDKYFFLTINYGFRYLGERKSSVEKAA